MTSSLVLFECGLGKGPLPQNYMCDLFLSAFNLSERVNVSFNRVQAKRKFWIVHNEYQFSAHELPSGSNLLRSVELTEAGFIQDCLSTLSAAFSSGQRICVDITGFMRPHLMFLLKFLRQKGLSQVDLIYAEPSQYVKREQTQFSIDVTQVRQVNGFEGAHSVNRDDDILLIGVGYEHDAVGQVMANKPSARVMQLLSLPSLSADMYQESLIRLQKVTDAPANVPDDQLGYSSANDPFITYIVLDEMLQKYRNTAGRISNIYLSPLATKPQAAGFALYYMKKLSALPASIVFPIAQRYSKETSVGVGRLWLYRVPLH